MFKIFVEMHTDILENCKEIPIGSLQNLSITQCFKLLYNTIQGPYSFYECQGSNQRQFAREGFWRIEKIFGEYLRMCFPYKNPRKNQKKLKKKKHQNFKISKLLKKCNIVRIKPYGLRSRPMGGFLHAESESEV